MYSTYICTHTSNILNHHKISRYVMNLYVRPNLHNTVSGRAEVLLCFCATCAHAVAFARRLHARDLVVQPLAVHVGGALLGVRDGHLQHTQRTALSVCTRHSKGSGHVGADRVALMGAPRRRSAPRARRTACGTARRTGAPGRPAR